MAKRTGKDLNVLIGGVVVSVSRGWSYEENSQDVDTTAAGDAVIDREPLRYDYTFEFNALLEVNSPYVLPVTARGTKVTWSAEIIASDANGIASGTGLCNRFRIEAAYDGAVAVSGSIVAGGTASTWDLSPAT